MTFSPGSRGLAVSSAVRHVGLSSMCVAFHVKKERIHKFPYRCAVKSSVYENLFYTTGKGSIKTITGLEVKSATCHCDKHTYCTEIMGYLDRSVFSLAVSFSLSVENKWDVFHPALGLPWQPNRGTCSFAVPTEA